jgi:Xaa-Pro aminopeptidase
VRKQLAAEGASAHVVIKLDQIAWLTNLRSFDDVPYNPVFLANLWIDREQVTLFLHEPATRLPAGFGDKVPGLVVRPYGEFRDFLAAQRDHVVLADRDRLTEGVLAALGCEDGRNRCLSGTSPIEKLKAIKNDAELRAMARANLMASAAKTRAILWLADRLELGEPVTERSFLEHLEGLYASIEGFRSLSFNTISATGEHAALPHYGDADDTPIQLGETFIIDSGIQVGGGTTDDTRTVGIGDATPEKARIFTLVLKAHLRGAMITFPAGTAGAAIDAIVRQPMWAEALDYSHGTGHGVGAFLNVHEGPFTLGDSKRHPASAVPLEPGMITSIEPGYYATSFGGVRHENLYVVVDRGRDDHQVRWLGFEPLTYIPFDVDWIDFDLLDERERGWLEDYHRRCLGRLASLLPAEEVAVLKSRLRME